MKKQQSSWVLSYTDVQGVPARLSQRIFESYDAALLAAKEYHTERGKYELISLCGNNEKIGASALVLLIQQISRNL